MTDQPQADLCACGHPWAEHDAMGDCTHLDGRTTTGLCERCPR